MPDASPAKWHLAHTTWFFETFLLLEFVADYRHFNEAFQVLFNSYYNGVGPQYSRPERGLLTRPSLDQVRDYRSHVTEHIADLARQSWRPDFEQISLRIELGINHEQQHQELLLTDIKHALFANPMLPSFRSSRNVDHGPNRLKWFGFDSGIYWVGHNAPGFCFDNETPRHRVYLDRFKIASRLVSNREYLEFIEDGGYQEPNLWLSEAWTQNTDCARQAPLYWMGRDDRWWEFTLAGLRPLYLDAPVMHVNYYEADAFARWAGKRLPTEQEWEVAAQAHNPQQAGLLIDRLQPAAVNEEGLSQLYGHLWQWTGSSYSPYPGYRPLPGVLGEYNGKFMVNQFVLRGGSFATPWGHVRSSYRNFFPSTASWQFSGIRLAESDA